MIKLFHSSTLISSLALLSSIFVAGSASAKYSDIFSPQQLALGFSVNQPVLVADILPSAGKELVIIGINEQQQRVLAIYHFDSTAKQYQLHDEQIIAAHFFAYDLGETNEDGLQHLYLLDKGAVHKYRPAHLSDEAQWQKVESVSSMYLGDHADELKRKDFVQDLNNDGLDDIVLPDFEQLNLWLSNCCGTRHKQFLPIAARIAMNDSSVSYDDKDLYWQDMNLDGQTDLALVEHGQLHIYMQTANKKFSTKPIKININSAIHPLDWWNIKGPNGQQMDQSNLEHRVVRKIADFNGDDIPDIAVQFTKSSGVLDKVIDFEFYYGVLKEGALSYSQDADTRVISEQTLNAPQFFDRETDGQQELLVSAFDIGISQIIGALLSGSIDQDVLVFSMNKNQQFDAEPLLSQEVQMTFNLTSGTQGEPLVKMMDINADGLKDLVFSDGDDEIRVVLAKASQKAPYARRALRQKMALPKNPYNAATEDLNGDGKSDIVLHYGRADSTELLKRVSVLLAK